MLDHDQVHSFPKSNRCVFESGRGSTTAVCGGRWHTHLPFRSPYILNRFYRADPFRNQVEGSGLGLSIARWIKDAHHDEMSVSSEKYKEGTFKIVFPPRDAPFPNV